MMVFRNNNFINHKCIYIQFQKEKIGSCVLEFFKTASVLFGSLRDLL